MASTSEQLVVLCLFNGILALDVYMFGAWALVVLRVAHRPRQPLSMLQRATFWGSSLVVWGPKGASENRNEGPHTPWEVLP